jgi:hypothetical protein
MAMLYWSISFLIVAISTEFGAALDAKWCKRGFDAPDMDMMEDDCLGLVVRTEGDKLIADHFHLHGQPLVHLLFFWCTIADGSVTNLDYDTLRLHTGVELAIRCLISFFSGFHNYYLASTLETLSYNPV